MEHHRRAPCMPPFLLHVCRKVAKFVKNKGMSDRRNSYLNIPTLWVLLIVVALAATWSVMYIFTLPMGDDLVYTSILRSDDGVGTGIYPLWKFPSYWVRHWVYTNGRSANMFASFTMGVMPHWLVSVMCGLAVGAMYLLVLYFCRLFPSRGKGLAATVLIAIVAFLFPWWDSFSLIDVNYNYVWATAMPLAVVAMLQNDRKGWIRKVGLTATWTDKLRTLAVALFCVLAGMCHEASGVALCAGMLWVAYMRGDISAAGWREMSRVRRWMLISFVAGVAIVTLSPGIIMRAMAEKTPDDVWWVLVLKSAPVTLVFLLVMICALFSSRKREKLRDMLMIDWAMWAVAAVAGLIFVAIGGIVGRSGWFSQTFALIALWQWWEPDVRRHVNRFTGTVLALPLGALVVAQMVDVDRYSYIGWKADSEVRALYAASPDGVVFYDMPDDTELPVWVFSRVRYLRPEDHYNNYGLRKYYKKESPLTLLPAAARWTDWRNFDPARALKLKKEWSEGFVALTPPANTVFPDDPGWVGWYVGREEHIWHPRYSGFGPQTVRNWVIPFEKNGRTFYYVRPYSPHFGDRFN